MIMTRTFTDKPLPILVSARIRLTHEQRKTVKDAYYKLKNANLPTESIGQGGIAVQTSYGTDLDLEKRLGMSHLVFMDIANTRDSISLNVILRLQEVLGIEVITKKDIEAACASYIDYMFNE